MMSISKHVMFESRSDDFYLLIKNVEICMYRQVLPYIGKSAHILGTHNSLSK